MSFVPVTGPATFEAVEPARWDVLREAFLADRAEYPQVAQWRGPWD